MHAQQVRAEIIARNARERLQQNERRAPLTWQKSSSAAAAGKLCLRVARAKQSHARAPARKEQVLAITPFEFEPRFRACQAVARRWA